MIFRKSTKTVKKGMGGMDKIITGIIIGGAAASIFGLSRSKKGKRIWARAYDGIGKYTKKGVGIFGKVTVKLISLFQKK